MSGTHVRIQVVRRAEGRWVPCFPAHREGYAAYRGSERVGKVYETLMECRRNLAGVRRALAIGGAVKRGAEQ